MWGDPITLLLYVLDMMKTRHTIPYFHINGHFQIAPSLYYSVLQFQNVFSVANFANSVTLNLNVVMVTTNQDHFTLNHHAMPPSCTETVPSTGWHIQTL